ncbi:MAG: polymer-forming cytoskeletal protein [Bacillota bacterium]|nr:polymer-forming cytoskeletal protein [Bacillota bacterium]MDW7677737.1 polymer-forming cytoskeletal protein [Bacillota bacterium]
MFSKKQESTKPQYEKFDTLVGVSTLVEGTIKTEEPLRIDGKVQGEIISKADVIVGEKGHIAGNVSCQNLMLAGTVQGNIKAAGQLHITPSGRLQGDARIQSFIVDEQGVFDGKCHMIQEPADTLNVQSDGGKADVESLRNETRSNRKSRLTEKSI